MIKSQKQSRGDQTFWSDNHHSLDNWESLLINSLPNYLPLHFTLTSIHLALDIHISPQGGQDHGEEIPSSLLKVAWYLQEWLIRLEKSYFSMLLVWDMDYYLIYSMQEITVDSTIEMPVGGLSKLWRIMLIFLETMLYGRPKFKCNSWMMILKDTWERRSKE